MCLIDDEGAVDLLARMVRTPSLSGDERCLATELRDFARALGFRSRLDGAGNWVAEWGTAGPELALVGHMDTVPGEWPVEIRDGRLHGRGSVDAKGPLAAFLVAASRIACASEAGGPPLRLRVVGCVEEEAPSSKGARHLARGPAPDWLVIGEPSGFAGVTLGYKGYLGVELVLRGECSHSAHDEPTLPARACALWNRIDSEAREWNRGRERAFDQLLPALVDLVHESDGREARVRLVLGIRLPEVLDGAAALGWLSERIDPRVVISPRADWIPAWQGPRTAPVARALGRAILAAGERPRFQVKTGTADLNILAPAWGCPAVAYGPGDAALDHRPDEHIVLEEYLASIEILKRAALELAAGSQTGIRANSGAELS